jgi:hypothetical protein
MGLAVSSLLAIVRVPMRDCGDAAQRTDGRGELSSEERHFDVR